MFAYQALMPGLILITLMGLIIALFLVLASRKFSEDKHSVVEQINALLPQTQCAQCDHPGCRPYAEAIANGEAINRCPPGGERTIKDLATLLGKEVLALDTRFGETRGPSIAKIRESECVGCTLCILACPVDAIIGATEQMHVVIESECTGCDLCLDACPVDCIDIVAKNTTQASIPLHIVRPIKDKPLLVSPCIRCGECELQCPKLLAPHELYWQRHSSEAMQNLDLDACIECRICDRVCPSHIPLTLSFIETKQRISLETIELENATHAETRFETRGQRLIASTQQVKTRATSKDRANLLSQLSKDKTGSNP